MEDVRQRKAAWRKRYAQLREGLGRQERVRLASLIAERVLALPAYREADILFAYVAVGAEVDTRTIIEEAWADGKVVAAPRVEKGVREMSWRRFASFEGLVKSPLGILEPSERAPLCTMPQGAETSLALVPGFVFDRRGHRLGYGGGYYDAFLEGLAGTSVGVIPSVQLVDELPFVEAHDRHVQIVATEGELVFC